MATKKKIKQPARSHKAKAKSTTLPAPTLCAARPPIGTAEPARDTQIDKKPSLDDVITAIMRDVDESFPSALQRDGGSINECAIPERLLFTEQGQDLEDQLRSMLIKGGEADDALLFQWATSREAAPVALAYCAGLRAAGMSETTTRQMMRGFLRRFEDPQEQI